MPIDTCHPDYEKMEGVWRMVRDVLEGERRIKEKGTTYLPALMDQESLPYARYKKRAQFVEITRQAHEELQGYLFRKDPIIEAPSDLDAFREDCTIGGLEFYDWLKDTTREVCGVGRRGTLIDWDLDLARPYIATYEAEQIKNWKVEKLGNEMILSLLVLYEKSTTQHGLGEVGGSTERDPYSHESYEQWRIYRVAQNGGGLPFLTCEIWRRKEQGTGGQALKEVTLPGTGPTGTVTKDTQDFVLVKQFFPARIGGFALDRIPFVFHGPNNIRADIDRAPMESMANVNLSHYRTSADHENGLHFSGLPQPWTKKFGENADKLAIGKDVVWYSDDEHAACGYLEVSNGFEGLEKALDRKEKYMANQGAKMFDSAAAGRSPEAYDTLRLRQTGQTVTLQGISASMTQSSTMVLQWALWWMQPRIQKPTDITTVSCMVNDDFVEVEIPSDRLTALSTMRSAQQISSRTLFNQLKQGEIYEEDWTFEDEMDAIKSDPPMLPPGATDATGAAFGGGPPKSGSSGGGGSGGQG